MHPDGLSACCTAAPVSPPALQEPNHHKTYVFLLETLGHKELSKMVLKTTYYYCR
jgi:hypothetical protein